MLNANFLFMQFQSSYSPYFSYIHLSSLQSPISLRLFHLLYIPVALHFSLFLSNIQFLLLLIVYLCIGFNLFDSFINERNRKKNIYDAEKAAIVSVVLRNVHIARPFTGIQRLLCIVVLLISAFVHAIIVIIYKWYRRLNSEKYRI